VLIFFEDAVDPEGSDVTYQVYLVDEPVNSDIREPEHYFTLRDLLHSTWHAGKIVAKDNVGNESVTEILMGFQTAQCPLVFLAGLIFSGMRS
jgi:hypothetical protein